MSILVISLVGLLLACGGAYGQTWDPNSQVPRNLADIPRSCNVNEGSVCIPQACWVKKCAIFQNATCIPDRCGCEARFFNWMDKDAMYSDVSTLCSSSNFVLNFINFTKRQEDSTAPEVSKEDEHTILLKFFKAFNVLTTELIRDFADWFKEVSLAQPTQQNIDTLKDLRKNLKLRVELSRPVSKIPTGSSNDDDTEAIQPVKVKNANQAEIQERIKLGGLVKTGKSFLGGLVGGLLQDEGAQNDDDINSKIDEALNRQGYALEDALRTSPDSVKNILFNQNDELTTTGKKFVIDANTLDGLTKKDGPFKDAIKSGGVALSDKNARTALRDGLKPILNAVDQTKNTQP